MGKKSATKVATAPAAAAVVQSGKKGKRGVENKGAKAVSAKKQKVERDETVVAKQKVEKKLPKKAASSSEEDESDESDSEIEPKVVAKKTPTPAKNNAKKDNSSDDSDASGSDSDISDDKPVAKKAPLVKNGSAAVKKGSTSDSSEASDSDSEDEDDDEKVAAEPKKVTSKPAELNDSSDSGDGSSDEDDEASGEDESDEEENEKQSIKTPKKKGGDVEMVDAKTPKTPATSEATGSKTLFVANLAFAVEESDVRDFFKDVGEVVDIRFASNAEGQFRGFGHVDFATAEAAQKALELHEQPLLDRPVRLDLAREKGERSASRENNSFQKGGKAQGQTAFVRGFDTSLGEDEIRSALQEHFGSCGEITRVSIPKDFESGGVKGMAYLDFADSNGFKEALGMDGSDLGGGFCLNVQEAKPKSDSGGRFGGGRSGGRGGGGGRFSGRGGRDGGRFSGRGGRDGGRGRGRGRSNFSGRRSTFGDH
ncbi:uncharacterized protein LOC141597297 isoform X1 [Silene latifolia]|uniref:uncharacterized protein LOC141597297 isoform X1 n=1 Tax=Silene latifolia TaxID=37657 RepID=UPI003D76B2DE